MKEKIGEYIHVCGTIVAIGLGGYAVYSDWNNVKERFSIQLSEVPRNFYLTRRGVSQEVEFVVVNEGLRSTIIQRVDISPGGLFPAPVLIDGEFWDGRPFSIEPNQVLTFRFLAEDEFKTRNTAEAREAAFGEPTNLGYLNLFSSHDHLVAVEERMDLPLHARNLERGACFSSLSKQTNFKRHFLQTDGHSLATTKKLRQNWHRWT